MSGSLQLAAVTIAKTLLQKGGAKLLFNVSQSVQKIATRIVNC